MCQTQGSRDSFCYLEPVWSVARAFVPAGKNTLRTTGIFCGKAFIAYLSGGKTPNRENGAAYIARSVTFQHLMWRDSSWFVARPSPHYYAPRWAVTWHKFTTAPAYIACLPVRPSRHSRNCFPHVLGFKLIKASLSLTGLSLHLHLLFFPALHFVLRQGLI